jgi:hypothetical protein
LKSPDWKYVVELIGVAAIVASLIFVGLELQQSRQIAMSEGALANAANELERYNAISNNADIWIRGNLGQELNEHEKLVFRNLVQTIQVTEFMEYIRLRRVGADDIAETLTADFAVFLFENPGARQVWSDDAERTTAYRTHLVPDNEMQDDEFVAAARNHLAELDRMKN